MKTNYLIKHFIGTLIFFTIIFISAGRIGYWQGLVYVIIGLIMLLLNYTVLRIDSELLNERSKPGEGTKQWDKTILGLSLIITMSMYITAGLDSGRYHWSPGFHWSIYLLGIILTILGQLLFLLAQKQNKFFSSTVRIQTNREHIVCKTGLYKIVRPSRLFGFNYSIIGISITFWFTLEYNTNMLVDYSNNNQDKSGR